MRSPFEDMRSGEEEGQCGKRLKVGSMEDTIPVTEINQKKNMNH